MYFDERTNFPQRGGIYYIDSYVSVGRALSPKQGRPAVIISRNERNKSSGTVQIVYLTHSEGANCRNPRLSKTEYSKVKDSLVVCDQIHTIDKNLVGDFIAKVDDKDMYYIEHRILNGLCIDPEKHCNTKHLENHIVNTELMQSEDLVYKRMYYELIDHLRGE